MTIRFQCDCGKKLKASNDKIGKRVLCPDCGEPVQVPARDMVAVEAIDRDPKGGEPLKDSAQTARELLKLTKEAAKGSAAEPRRPGEEGMPLSEIARYIAVQAALPAVGVLVGCLILYWIAWQIYGGGAKYPDLYPVSGRVTLNGKPLEGATVTFRLRKAAQEGQTAAESVGRTDSDGRYRLEYVPGVRGAVLGEHYVEIRKTGPDGLEMLPARFHEQTELTATVTEDKDEGYDFALTLPQR